MCSKCTENWQSAAVLWEKGGPVLGWGDDGRSRQGKEKSIWVLALDQQRLLLLSMMRGMSAGSVWV